MAYMLDGRQAHRLSVTNQVTIPTVIRDVLGVKAGDFIRYVKTDTGGVMIERVGEK